MDSNMTTKLERSEHELSSVRRAQPRLSNLPELKLVQSSRKIRWLANVVFVGLVLATIAVMFLPWQQTAKGSGRVIAFVPQERQQTVTSPIKGIVSLVAPGLREGDLVKKDQIILELQPAAANLGEQLDSQIRDLQSKLTAIQIKVDVYAQNVIDFGEARDFAVQAAKEMVDSAIAKRDAKQRLIPAYQAKELQARLNLERQVQLAQQGATSEKEVEMLRRDWDVAKSELESAQLDVQAAEFEKAAKEHELEQKRNEAQTKVDNARAYEQSAVSDKATVQKELRDLSIKKSELEQLVIRAPRDGTIFRLPVFERGQTVKEGEPLFTIVPETQQLAVEIWVDGNDVSLVLLGDHVRLQFEGWPAIQFAGWPSVAVGTFGGEVVAIDGSDDGTGKFRVQVRPLPDAPWPESESLRQGVRTNGWVMLRRVALGYEIWRQLNGFPPTRSDNSPAMEKTSAPKIKVG